MHAPEGMDALRHQELMLYLPTDWNLDFATGGESSWWPFRLLLMLVTYVRERETFYAEGHAIVPHDSRTSFAPDSLLSAALLLPPTLEDEGFQDGPVRFLHVLPITNAELEYKLQTGTDALLELFQSRKLPVEVISWRPCQVTEERP